MILNGNALDELRGLEAESVHCCITSPPYWGLRDYGLPPMVWGGAEGCSHEWQKHIKPAANGIIHDRGMTGETLSARSATRQPKVSAFCFRCGAWRGSFGLEPTPELYVKHTVEIFREVKRVLRKDGTVWLNLGDSYAASRSYQVVDNKYKDVGNKIGHTVPPGLKPKDLVGIPWRVAFALQADGWWLRQDIIWHKPNPMPESVTDRCTKAHEYIFLLTKSAKYHYDHEAIKEPANPDSQKRYSYGYKKHGFTQNIGSPIDRRKGTDKKAEQFAHLNGRNKRSVWTIATKPYKEAHFATFPPKLIEPCVLAGCPEGGTVLDPFSGAGTTGIVAYNHHREFIGIELNSEYCEIAEKRIESETRQMRMFG